jgi:hypothetical protein
MAFSQEKGAAGAEGANEADKPAEYVVKPNFPTNVYHKYQYTDKSEVTRFYSNEDSVTYKREVNYFLTLRAPDWRTEDDKLEIFVTIDSMLYKLEDTDNTYTYDSQDDESNPPFHVADFDYRAIQLGLEYSITLSPYNEIINVESEKLEFKRNFINDETTGIKDEFKKFYWERGLSDMINSYVCDPQKGLLPDEPISIDSSWTDIVPIRLDDFFAIDTVKMTLKQFNINNYILEGESIGSTIPEGANAFVHKINKIPVTDTGNTSGTYKFRISAQGIVELFEFRHEGEVEYFVNRDKVRDKIITEQSWELVKVSKW